MYRLVSLLYGWNKAIGMLIPRPGLTYGIINDTKGEINWRIPMAMQGIPCIIVLVFVWILPESPRWLMSRGRTVEARSILTKYGSPYILIIRLR